MKKIPWLAVFLIAVQIALRIPFSNAPMIYDEPGYLQGTVRTAHNQLNPFVYFDGYKPPVSFWPPAVFSELFGSQYVRVYARLYVAIASAAALYFIYRLGSLLYGEAVGISSMVLLFLFPLFFIQSFQYSDSLIVTALSLAALYYHAKHARGLYAVASSLLVLSKETMIPLVGILLIHDVYTALRQRTNVRGAIVSHGVCFLMFLSWAMVNYRYFGWYINPASSPGAHGILGVSKWTPFYIGELADRAFTIFIADIPVWLIFALLSAGYLLSLEKPLYRKSLWSLPAIGSIALFFGYLVLYTIFASIERYMLFAYAVLLILYAQVIHMLFKRTRTRTIVIGLTCAAYLGYFIYATFLRTYSNSGLDLTAFAYPSAHRYVMSEAYRLFPNATMITKWPWANYWSIPETGMVPKQGDLEYCDPLSQDIARCSSPSPRAMRTLFLIETCDASMCELDTIRSSGTAQTLTVRETIMWQSSFIPRREYWRLVEVK